MPGKVVVQKYITRQDLIDNRETLFVFGDNMSRRGFGGQAAEMRGEPNAVGIPTKWFPSMKPAAFFQEKDFEKVKSEISMEFSKLERHLSNGGTVVFPKDGIGTGLSNLQQHAPSILNFINASISTLIKISKT